METDILSDLLEALRDMLELRTATMESRIPNNGKQELDIVKQARAAIAKAEKIINTNNGA